MAARERDILQAIDDIFAAETATGGRLDIIQQYHVDHTKDEFPTEVAFPFVYIFLEDAGGGEVSIPPCMTRKAQNAHFQAYTVKESDVHTTSVAELLDRIENVFFQQNLGISDLLVRYQGKNYTIPTELPVQEWLLAGGELIYQYEYTDIRDIP